MQGLAPLFNAQTQTLILGSAPSQQSLQKQQYYGNNGNQFWKIIGQVLHTPVPDNYAERTRLLLAHGIGLWDVYQEFDRQGSMDHQFQSTTLNHFETLLAQTDIQRIIINGQKASQEVKKQGLYTNYEVIHCPSTSGANNGQQAKRLRTWTEALAPAQQAIYFGSDPWLQAAAYRLREEVFVQEQQIPRQWEFDAIDGESPQYFVWFDNYQPIATIRYQALDHQTIQPDRFCVTANRRKQGIGTKLLKRYEQQALTDGYRYAQLVAEQTAINFYEQQGYQVSSKPYIQDGIPCVTMRKKLEK